MRFLNPLTDYKQAADLNAVTVSQGLYGEHVEIVRKHGDWYAIRNTRDAYEGYVLCNSLGRAEAPSTHTVCVRSTLLFATPDIKSRIVQCVPFGAELVLVREHNNQFFLTADGEYVWRSHCRVHRQAGAHSVAVAQRDAEDLAGFAANLFLGAPYLWGGRSPAGFDCSGLVQMAAFAVGRELPRDSGQQERHLTNEIAYGERRRADLVFWPGHVGILMNAFDLLHATAHSLQSLVEPLTTVQARAGDPSSVMRLRVDI